MKAARKKLVFAGIGALLVCGVGAAALGTTFQEPEPAAAPETTTTAVVSKGNLVEHVKVTGTLAYGGSHAVGTALTGTLTSLPAPGSEVVPGGELFRVDDAPVLLMRGELPGWRPFEIGMAAGRDVKQLEQNLAELGYLAETPDEVFGWATANAIGSWQTELGMKRTGTLENGRIVFEPGPLRVASVKAAVGTPASQDVMSATSPEKRITAEVKPSLSSIVSVGKEVSSTLPDGTNAAGKVVAVGAAVERDGKGGVKEVKLPVTVSLSDPKAAEAFSNVSVALSFTRELSKDALLVPVLALLAQNGGGYAVETVKDGTVQTVPVELGAFANGQVQVTKGVLYEGDHVVVGQ